MRTKLCFFACLLISVAPTVFADVVPHNPPQRPPLVVPRPDPDPLPTPPIVRPPVLRVEVRANEKPMTIDS